MADLEVLTEKTKSIQNYLKRIHDNVKGDLNRIDNFDVQDIVTLNLQRAVQLVIDIAFHMVSKDHMGIPQSLEGLFIILEKYGVLEHELSVKMQKMIGFRNIAVYDYQAINPAILKSIVASNLKDIEDFYTAMLRDCPEITCTSRLRESSRG